MRLTQDFFSEILMATKITLVAIFISRFSQDVKHCYRQRDSPLMNGVMSKYVRHVSLFWFMLVVRISCYEFSVKLSFFQQISQEFNSTITIVKFKGSIGKIRHFTSLILPQAYRFEMDSPSFICCTSLITRSQLPPHILAISSSLQRRRSKARVNC